MTKHEFAELLDGATDLDYLDAHYSRFCFTREFAYSSWTWTEADILDIGAHWLHQSLLYAMDGHRVTAADFSNPLEHPDAIRIAAEHKIKRLVYQDLSSERVFDELADDSMDVILFCEILEHITFNPVGMWKAIYRVLRPGGRIIITTPNYYSLSKLPGMMGRFLFGRGGGISIADILNIYTNSSHWKEYSVRELSAYFGLLSPDFVVRKARYFAYKEGSKGLNWKGKLAYDKGNIIPIFREGIYVEIDLVNKSTGIKIQPGWH